jgi:hypothetical protein
MRLGWRMQRQNIHVCIQPARHLLARGGRALSFGTEGSLGPVFFADDAQARVFGRLRDGGEAAFALREHEGWKSLYLAMLNFGPELLRNLARFAGAHVWCASNDVLYANRSLLCLHTASAGRKRIVLPAPALVTDLWTGGKTSNPVRQLELDLERFRTKMWQLEM